MYTGYKFMHAYIATISSKYAKETTCTIKDNSNNYIQQWKIVATVGA